MTYVVLSAVVLAAVAGAWLGAIGSWRAARRQRYPAATKRAGWALWASAAAVAIPIAATVVAVRAAKHGSTAEQRATGMAKAISEGLNCTAGAAVLAAVPFGLALWTRRRARRERNAR